MRINLLVPFLIVLFVLSCSEKEKAFGDFSELNQYQEIISEVSHGVISVKSDVRVVLNMPITTWQNGNELDDDLLKVSPNVKGKVVSLNDRTIAFIPENEFEQDTEYQFVLNVKDLVEQVPEELETLVFGVKTFKQQFNVYTNELQSYSKDWQYVEGQIRFADVITSEDVKKLITADHKGKSVGLKFDTSFEETTQFQFRLDSIQRFEDDSELTISWDGSKLNIESSGNNSLKIPGKNNFSVLNISVDMTDKGAVFVNFSDPIKKDQNFKGLVVLKGDDNPKFSVSGNTLKVYPSEDLKGTIPLEIFEGIESADGYKLKSKFEGRVAFEQLKPQVRLLSNGNILPSSENLKINFETVGLKAVDVQVLRIFENNVMQFLQDNNLDGSSNLRAVARPIAKKKIVLESNLNSNIGKWMAHAIDLKSLITPEQGAIYRVEFNFRPSYSKYTCESTNFSEKENTDENFDEEEESSAWDGIENYYEYGYYNNYNWKEHENPCNTSYYYDKKVGINVMATDIGVTVKRGLNKSYFVAVTDILSTKPIVGAKVTFYNFQQQPLGEVLTDNDGMSMFDSEKLAYFAIAEYNNQKTYVKLGDGNALSVSKFNVSGTKLQKGIKGFVFGERGVWRPGDQMYLSFILNDNANKLPKNHPVKFELLDPYNKVIHREVKTLGINNFYQFNVKTDENAPTGNWLAKVSVGGASFTKSIKIETIKPNRLKIKAGFDADILTSAKPVQGNLEVLWLHGAIAKNLAADINAKFNPTTTSFKTFTGYVFDDPSVVFSPVERTIFNGKINAEGKANFTMAPNLESKAPGMLKAAFITKVYENGGDFSTDVFTKTYSPYKTYIGLNVPKGDKNRGMLLTDVKHKFEVVSVDESGKPKATDKLKVTIHKVNWRWWWDTSANNQSDFSSSSYRKKVFEEIISTNANGKGSFNFELKYPDWGRYLVRVEDQNGGHSTGKDIYVDWPGWAGKSNKNDPSAATMLLFSTDKEKYKVGETALVNFPSSEGGRALVTVENGTEVLESLWVETKQGETKFQIPISELYTPNVFISINLLQPHASTKNDSPIRMYGIVPISVENPNTKLQPEISMPEVLQPEETITVKVKEQKGKAMTYSIAIVDEGLLDLTRYKTPDPWGTFYAHEALGIKTWDIFDEVIGAFGGRINQVFAIGGDGVLAGAKNKKANRFEPIVMHLGPFSLNKGETKSHKIKIPKYIGSVRTMVVASNSNSEAYGMAEKATPVRKPLMILASLPRKITPGEKVTLPVTVFAMEKKVKNVTIKIKDNEAFTISGGNTKSLTFAQPDEKMVYFDLDISDVKGIGKVIVEASGNGEKASFEIPIDVVNPNPVTSEVTDIVIDANGSQTINLKTFGLARTNSAQIEFSTLPPMNFNGRMQYLIRYPHGCVEQTTSAAFPQLSLSTIFDVSSDKKKKIQANIESAIKRLGSYQNASGGFSYWPNQAQANDWGTSYAGHFLLEAGKKGYVLPIGFKSSWVNYQQQVAKQWRARNDNDLAQAYRLYTLALSGNADMASMNRLRESSNVSNEAKYRLAATYALVGQKKVAQSLLNATSFVFKEDIQNNYTYGSTTRNQAMALETLVLAGDKSKAQDLAKSLAQRLIENKWMSTQSTSYSLLAMAKFVEMVGGKRINANITINGKSETVSTEKTLANRNIEIKKGNNSIILKNSEASTLYISIVNSGILPVGEEKIVQRNLMASVSYKGRNGSRLNVSKIQQGTDFIAEVTLKNTSDNKLKDVALIEIFPSGWEIVNTRFTNFGSFDENKVTYTDLRDDRANFYFDMQRKETKTFRVLVNASFLGRYYLPGVQAEGMYDNDYEVRTKGQWIEVVQ